MSVRVGIPRALLYYYYFPLWKEFLEQLGAEVVVSAPTTKGILTRGVEQCVDEACLPIKLAFGHVQNLADKGVDVIFLPRMVSVAQREYICPKFLGFPDMVRQNIKNLPVVMDTSFNLRKKQSDVTDFVQRVGAYFGKGIFKSRLAFGVALRKQKQYQDLLEQGLFPEEAMAILEGKEPKSKNINTDLTIAVIGHPYNIYDPFISMNLLNRLNKMGVKVLTADHLTEQKIEQGAAKLPKKLFWTLSKKITGGALHFHEKSTVDGIIHVAAFACGPDSMTGELIERFIRREGRMPFLNINLDEHTGEAGIITRVEAFLDMVRWRRAVG
ncbi:acyl-CoA dehydratase activase-related protein [Desulfotomaculum sp. 1211_IL3151]|uniref:acyl-CoA dehydratase activase-related protein n=1 Tax=Desulfotomaculum sp. 1211_IL3151 TaxID=3084055 RepID=UPI002FD98695